MGAEVQSGTDSSQPPRSPAVTKYVNASHYYRSIVESEKAIAAMTKAIALAPTDAGLYAEREELYANTFVMDKAFADANKAIQLDPKQGLFFRRRERLYYLTGQWNKAVADLIIAIKLSPTDPEPHFDCARAYKKLAKYDKSIEQYRTYMSFKNAKHVKDSGNELGELYLKVGKPQDAIDTFTRYIAIFPDLPQGYYGRAKAYDAIGKTQLAITDRNRAREAEKEF